MQTMQSPVDADYAAYTTAEPEAGQMKRGGRGQLCFKCIEDSFKLCGRQEQIVQIIFCQKSSDLRKAFDNYPFCMGNMQINFFFNNESTTNHIGLAIALHNIKCS